MLLFDPKTDVISKRKQKKKGFHRNFNGFFQPKSSDLQKKEKVFIEILTIFPAFT